jgi:hypothetical protein
MRASPTARAKETTRTNTTSEIFRSALNSSRPRRPKAREAARRAPAAVCAASPSSARSPSAPAAPRTGRHLRHGAGNPGRRRGAASHFSCIGATKRHGARAAGQLKAMGVKRLVALRGDLPSGYGAGGEFHYASDLVAFIREETGAPSTSKWRLPRDASAGQVADADLQAFVAKVKAGADSAITQYFFNARRLLPLRRRRAQAGRRHAGRARHHADHQLDAADALFRCLRRRDPALDPPAAAGLRRRHGIDQGLRPRRGHRPVRAAARAAARRAAFLHDEPGRGDAAGCPSSRAMRRRPHWWPSAPRRRHPRGARRPCRRAAAGRQQQAAGLQPPESSEKVACRSCARRSTSCGSAAASSGFSV